ncbi:MAG TPA: hypothetical protein VGF55_05885, partial [Gemmataceae bacterium]
WWLLPPRPRTQWPTAGDGLIGDILADGPTVVTSPQPPLSSVFSRPYGPFHFRDAASGRVREVCGPEDDRPIIGFSPDGAWLLLEANGRLQLCPAGGGAVTDLEPPGPDDSGPLRERHFSPDGRFLAFGDKAAGSRTVQLFDLRAQRPAGRLDGVVRVYGFAADGRAIVYRSAAGDCVLSECPGGRVWFRCPAGDCYGAEVSPAGDRLLQFCGLGDDRRRVVVWDTTASRELCAIPFGVSAVAPGAKRRLFTADECPDDSRQVSVWDTGDGALVASMTIPRGARLDWQGGWASSDGRTVALIDKAEADPVRAWLERRVPWLGVKVMTSRAKLVDVTTGTTAGRLPGDVTSTMFAPDGRAVAALGDGMLRVWDVPPRKPLTWFAVAAGLLAVPPAGLAWRRVRGLRRPH